MEDDPVGPFSKIVSVRPGRNRLPDEDRNLAELRRKLKKRKGDDDEDGEGGSGHYEPGPGHEAFQDDASVLGIPNDEMTDNVRHAIDLLMEEIQHLRHELIQARGHEQFLEEQAEKDHLLHVMRRRVFLARINVGIQRVGEEAVQFSLIYIPVTNASTVRSGFGHSAAEAMMVQAADALRENMIPGDVIGSLEQSDFGILMPGTPLKEAETRALALLESLRGRTFVWQGEPIGIEGAFGVTELAAQDSAEAAVERARADQTARANNGL